MAAVWAPSVHNTQPWQFTAAGQQLSLHADAMRQLAVADPDGREMMISCGAALFTARLALRPLGYLPEASVLPDPGQPLLVAQVSWGGRTACTEFEQALFGQVRQRRTHRGAFDLVLLPGLLATLREGAARYGTMLRIVADGRTAHGRQPSLLRPAPARDPRALSAVTGSCSWPVTRRSHRIQRFT